MSRLLNGTSSDYLRDDTAPLTAQPLTFACWFRTTTIAAATTGQLIWIGNSAVVDQYFGLARRVDTARLAIVQGATNINVQGAGEVSVGPWFHAAATISGTTRLTYVNGVLIATGSVVAATPTGLNRIALGRIDGSSALSIHGGHIAEAGVWNVASGPEVIAALSRGVSPLAGGIIPAPIRYYRLKADGDFSDASGNGGAITNVGTVWSTDHPPVMDEYGRFDNPGRPLAMAA